ncbi:MAG: hypothetical protein ACTS5F_01070 [Candidatus Hodgkinia cicadicola]
MLIQARTSAFAKGNLNERAWSWLRTNAGGKPNTCKLSGRPRKGRKQRTGE